ncbi:hypothetical protein ACF044_05050 [Microbacterium sp. NPDC016588]
MPEPTHNPEAGMFSRVGESREIEGLLLPFGELSRPNLTGTESIMFSAAAVALPRDPSIVTLNDEHDRFNPLGRGVAFTKTDAGVRGRFAIANTDEGDAFLAAFRDGTSKRKLSAELGSLFRNGVNAVRSRLTGAAVCTDGAFESAALFSLAPGQNVEFTTDVPASDEYSAPDRDNASRTVSEYTDSEGVRWRRIEEYSSKTTVEKVTPTEADTPADTNPDTEGTLMGKIVPGGAATATPQTSLNGMFAAYAGTGDRDVYRDSGELFALAVIADSGPNGATIGADTDRRGYLGELWQRAPYQRRFVPLVGKETLTDFRMTGWKWVTEPEMDDYEGNGKEVPSNVADTLPVDVVAKRLAGGARLDRKFRDFGNTEVPTSYVVKQTESYKRKTDHKVLAGLLANSTVTAPGVVPAGIPKGLAAIVDGALGVIDSENRPAFAIVAGDLWRDIVLMADDDKLAFLSAGFGLEEGDVAGFKIAPAPVGVGAGKIPAGRVIVGAKEGYTFYELGETPIRVEGVVPGNGADDLAAFGYWAELGVNAAAIRSVQTAA